jgi:hypothetical protein
MNLNTGSFFSCYIPENLESFVSKIGSRHCPGSLNGLVVLILLSNMDDADSRTGSITVPEATWFF